MSIKSDKTFEEIVERLVALFRGQHEDGVTEARAQFSSSESPAHTSSSSPFPVRAEERRRKLIRD